MEKDLFGSIVSVVKRDESKALLKLYVQNPQFELPLNKNGKIAVG